MAALVLTSRLDVIDGCLERGHTADPSRRMPMAQNCVAKHLAVARFATSAAMYGQHASKPNSDEHAGPEWFPDGCLSHAWLDVSLRHAGRKMAFVLQMVQSADECPDKCDRRPWKGRALLSAE